VLLARAGFDPSLALSESAIELASLLGVIAEASGVKTARPPTATTTHVATRRRKKS